ncbi:MAG: dihydroxyacetone kinase subunit L [Rectinema subterraneum]
MEALLREHLEPLFFSIKESFERNKEFLIDLDSKTGDGDLGLTMSKAFSAAHESVKASNSSNLGQILAMVGIAISRAAPSTMGTLMATGFMRGGKAIENAQRIGTKEMADFWLAFSKGIADRGKATEGDKTILDVAAPIAKSFSASAEKNESLAVAMRYALDAAGKAIEATKSMIAQHGKAAVFREKTIGLQDAGGSALYILVKTMHDFVLA